MTMTAAVADGQAPDSGAGLAEVIDDELVARLAGQARAQGLSLVGEGGLLQQLTKRVIEAALDGEMTVVQTCIVHLLRNSFKYASRKDWAAIARDLKPVYTAATEQAALDRFAEFAGIWEKKYPAIIRLWTSAWAERVDLAGVRVGAGLLVSWVCAGRRAARWLVGGARGFSLTTGPDRLPDRATVTLPQRRLRRRNQRLVGLWHRLCVDVDE